MRFRLLLAAIPTCAAALVAFSCGSESDGVSPAADGGAAADGNVVIDGSAEVDSAFRPDASCPVVVETPSLLAAQHVAIDTSVTYSSNPPSSGPHYPVWAAFQEYQAPVDWRYLVHDLEHGAVVFAYKCATAAACPEVVAALRVVADAVPADPLCTGSGVKNRVILVPDPNLASPVAAAAWGHTYKGDCVDAPTLSAFATEHYGKGPEAVCANGEPGL